MKITHKFDVSFVLRRNHLVPDRYDYLIRLHAHMHIHRRSATWMRYCHFVEGEFVHNAEEDPNIVERFASALHQVLRDRAEDRRRQIEEATMIKFMAGTNPRGVIREPDNRD